MLVHLVQSEPRGPRVEDAAGAAPEGESDEPMAKRELTWPGGEDGSSDSGTDEEDEEEEEEESVAANRALSNSSIGSVYKLERFASADDGAAGCAASGHRSSRSAHGGIVLLAPLF